jgi:acetophenone carboxylase
VLVPRAEQSPGSVRSDDDEVRSAVKGLFDAGIRRINISLQGAFEDDSPSTRSSR